MRHVVVEGDGTQRIAVATAANDRLQIWLEHAKKSRGSRRRRSRFGAGWLGLTSSSSSACDTDGTSESLEEFESSGGKRSPTKIRSLAGGHDGRRHLNTSDRQFEHNNSRTQPQHYQDTSQPLARQIPRGIRKWNQKDNEEQSCRLTAQQQPH